MSLGVSGFRVPGLRAVQWQTFLDCCPEDVGSPPGQPTDHNRFLFENVKTQDTWQFHVQLLGKVPLALSNHKLAMPGRDLCLRVFAE